jgi:hypothetical protein
MNLSRLGVLIVVSALALAGCATGKKAEATVPPDGRVEGALTINGKTFPLKYVYAGRYKPAETRGPGGIEVVVTNEPLSHETLSRIFLELEVDLFRRKESQVLKGTSIKALYFDINAYRLEMASERSECVFDGMLMTADAFFNYSPLEEARDRFDQFSFKDRTITAKASNKWKQTEIAEGLQDDIEIAAEYTISFEANVSDQSLLSRSLSTENKSWQESLSKIPEEGKADGTLMVSKRTVKLSHAYVVKQKLPGQAGETIEVITLLLSDRPIRKEFLLLSFERGLVGDGYVLLLGIDESGAVIASSITYPNGQNGMFDPTSAKAFKVENGRVTGSAENVSASTLAEPSEQDRYSVSFDAPLKK